MLKIKNNKPNAEDAEAPFPRPRSRRTTTSKELPSKR